MKKGIFYIILSFILTLAVTEYVWIELLREKQVVAELETEKELEEDLIEEFSLADQLQLLHFFDSSEYSSSFKNDLNGFAIDFNALRSVVKCKSPKLFILHRQLLVHC